MVRAAIGSYLPRTSGALCLGTDALCCCRTGAAARVFFFFVLRGGGGGALGSRVRYAAMPARVRSSARLLKSCIWRNAAGARFLARGAFGPAFRTAARSTSIADNSIQSFIPSCMARKELDSSRG